MDYTTDLYDSSSHLNPSGAKKVTEILGQFITEHYSIEDHRDDDGYSEYWIKFGEYQKYKMQLIKEQTFLKEYLMLLNDPDFSIEIQGKQEEGSDFQITVKLSETLEFVDRVSVFADKIVHE